MNSSLRRPDSKLPFRTVKKLKGYTLFSVINTLYHTNYLQLSSSVEPSQYTLPYTTGTLAKLLDPMASRRLLASILNTSKSYSEICAEFQAT